MANIFKTTLKKDVIADIANKNQREIRFPMTKFWATRLSDTYNLEDKVFEFKTFDTLELSSPSNKDTISETFVVGFVRTYVDGDEFVVEFKMDSDNEISVNENKSAEAEEVPTQCDDVDTIDGVGETVESCENTEVDGVKIDNNSRVFNERNLKLIEITKGIKFEVEEVIENEVDIDGSDVNLDEKANDEEILCISNEDVFNVIAEWFYEEKIVDNLYELDSVFATNARQVIILPKGRVLGSKKILPVNNDVEVRVEFDMNKKVYYDPSLVIDFFANDIYRTLKEICKNNFVFIWKRYTGIFMDKYGQIYFGIKYSTRKSIRFNRKYNVQ